MKRFLLTPTTLLTPDIVHRPHFETGSGAVLTHSTCDLDATDGKSDLRGLGDTGSDIEDGQ